MSPFFKQAGPFNKTANLAEGGNHRDKEFKMFLPVQYGNTHTLFQVSYIFSQPFFSEKKWSDLQQIVVQRHHSGQEKVSRASQPAHWLHSS